MTLKLLIIILIILSFYMFISGAHAQNDHVGFVKSIDTMKISRDLAREKENDNSFNAIIDQEVKQIADTGATHIAIGTPYDEEFLPYLERWVTAARQYHLRVWFRGNFAGWEKWFGYEGIDRETHTKKLEAFILANKHLFQDGDIFTSCPECENGGPGDPRMNGDVKGHRAFLITEYKTAKKAFAKINKKVAANYYSMNGDVALLVMDKPTTNALDGVVTVDHYVTSPEKLVEDIKVISASSGGKVMIGETGVPVLDIHGDISQKDSAAWMAVAFGKLRLMREVVGINYWVNVGGTTALWENEGKPKEIASVVTNFYSGTTMKVSVLGKNNKPVKDATIETLDSTITADASGVYHVPFLYTGQKMTISAKNYTSVTKVLSKSYNSFTVSMVNSWQEETWWEKLLSWLHLR
jgi:hypothetical protein